MCAYNSYRHIARQKVEGYVFNDIEKSLKSSRNNTFQCPCCQKRQLCTALFNNSYLSLSKALTE